MTSLEQKKQESCRLANNLCYDSMIKLTSKITALIGTSKFSEHGDGLRINLDKLPDRAINEIYNFIKHLVDEQYTN